jgi:hypothetical protein
MVQKCTTTSDQNKKTEEINKEKRVSGNVLVLAPGK